MAEGPSQTMEDLLTCSLCLELFREPKTLTCLHSYCKECLTEMKEKTNECHSILCPLCRDETAMPEKGIEGLPTNFFIKNLLEVAELRSKNESLLCSNCEEGSKAVTRCVECNEFFCQKCVDAHDRLKTNQEHRVVNLKKLISPETSKEFHPAMKCPNHDLVCRFYCRTCNVLICRDCTVVDHPQSSHSFANLNDVANQCRERSLEAMAKAEKQLAHMKQVQDTCREKKDMLMTTVDTVTTKLRERKEYLIQQFTQAIEGRSSEMISQLEQFMLDNVEQNKRDDGQLESDVKRMGNYVLFMHNLLANGNDDEMMNMYDHLVRYLNDGSSRNPFWLDTDSAASPSVSLQWLTKAGEDVLDSSVDNLVTTCLGELEIPTLQPKHFELVDGRGQVFDVGKEAKITIKSSNCDSTLPTATPPDLTLFRAKVLTPKQTVIQGRLQLRDDGTLSVHFTSYIQGRHRVAVQLHGYSLRGSPLTLEIKGEPDYSIGTNLLQKLPLDHWNKKQKWLCSRTDQAGNIYILGGNEIVVFDAAFNPLYIIELHGVMKKPWNFTIDGDGRIIVSDTGCHKLFLFGKDGTFLLEFGAEGKGLGELNSPLGVTVDSYGNIAVCDSGNRRIQFFNQDTSFKSSFSSEQDVEIMYPLAIQINSQGQIIVSESSLWFWNYRPSPAGSGTFDVNNAVECIKIFSRDGQVLQKFGEPGEGRGQFWAPVTIAVDFRDYIWVADFTYGHIQVFDEKGNVKEVFACEEKERGTGWLTTITTASNGAVLYYRLYHDM